MLKFIFVLNIALIISAFLIANYPTNSQFAELSSLFIVAFAVPSLIGLFKALGKKRFLLTFFTLGTFAIVFEYFSIKTGFPYGTFTYTSNVGLKIADTVPWAISFAWVPLVLGSFLLSSKYFSKNAIKMIIASALILVASDFILDPGAVALNMWIWEGTPFLYDIPLSNYFGWLISGLIGSTLLFILNKDKLEAFKLNKKWFYISFYILVGFWTYIDLFKGLWIAVIVGILLLLATSKQLMSK